jgi:glutamate synthase (NADPH/NADH) small chain
MIEQQIIDKANYCLNCINKPCSTKGCPMHTKIPEFISMIKEKNLQDAYKILKENNLFSYICALICPQEEQCEGSCIRGIKQTPTEIGLLEKYVNEWAIENNIDIEYTKKAPINKKVAIIGGGPAGLECAFELLLAGCDVTIYEKEKLLGGILTYGIPDFRLDKKIVEEIVDTIKNLGTKICTEVELGKNLHLQDLQKQYDAIFIGIGATKSVEYPLYEEKLASIYKSDEFLKSYAEGKKIDELGKVVIIGGGNVAMDCSRVAIRLGAQESKILYRRDEEHMPARKIELADAIADGVKWHEKVRVISANVEDGKLVSLNCIRTEIVDKKAVDISGSEFVEEANSVVFAIGLKPDKSLIESQGLLLNDWGMIEADENGKTSINMVYTGGDTIENRATVCKAIADGRNAAKDILNQFK